MKSRLAVVAAAAAAELVAKGKITTNQLVLMAPKPITTSAPAKDLAYDKPAADPVFVQFGQDPVCVRIEGRSGGTELAFTTGQGLSLGQFQSSSEGDSTLAVTNLKVAEHMNLSSGSLTISGVKQWRLHLSESFKMNEPPSGWDTNLDIVTSCAGVVMMGGYGKFAKGEISKAYTDLPAHSYVRIVANFHFIDNWTGDSGFMRVDAGKDGSLIHVWSDSHKVTSTAGVNLCGKVNVPETKFSVPIDVTIPHSLNAIKIAFGSTLQANIPEEASWGVSLIELYLR